MEFLSCRAWLCLPETICCAVLSICLVCFQCTASPAPSLSRSFFPVPTSAAVAAIAARDAQNARPNGNSTWALRLLLQCDHGNQASSHAESRTSLVGQPVELDDRVRAILSSFLPFGVSTVMDRSWTCADVHSMRAVKATSTSRESGISLAPQYGLFTKLGTSHFN